jgi:hypothetical protein
MCFEVKLEMISLLRRNNRLCLFVSALLMLIISSITFEHDVSPPVQRRHRLLFHHKTGDKVVADDKMHSAEEPNEHVNERNIYDKEISIVLWRLESTRYDYYPGRRRFYNHIHERSRNGPNVWRRNYRGGNIPSFKAIISHRKKSEFTVFCY